MSQAEACVIFLEKLERWQTATIFGDPANIVRAGGRRQCSFKACLSDPEFPTVCNKTKQEKGVHYSTATGLYCSSQREVVMEKHLLSSTHSANREWNCCSLPCLFSCDNDNPVVFEGIRGEAWQDSILHP